MVASCARMRVSFGRGYQQTYHHHDRSVVLIPNIVCSLPGTGLSPKQRLNRALKTRSSKPILMFIGRSSLQSSANLATRTSCTCMYTKKLTGSEWQKKISYIFIVTVDSDSFVTDHDYIKLSVALGAYVCHGTERIVGWCWLAEISSCIYIYIKLKRESKESRRNKSEVFFWCSCHMLCSTLTHSHNMNGQIPITAGSGRKEGFLISMIRHWWRTSAAYHSNCHGVEGRTRWTSSKLMLYYTYIIPEFFHMHVHV